MDVVALEELKNDLLNGEILKHRRLLAGLAIFLVAFTALTIVGGYVLVTHAMNENQVTNVRGINTPSEVSLLFEGHHPTELINNLVFLNRVKLSSASEKSSNVYYAGDESQKLLVVSHGTTNPPDQSVANVFGTVRPLTSEMMKKWKLSKQEQKELKKQGVYIDAQSVKVPK